MARRAERSEEDFESWLAAALERADPFMAWLGVVFALVVGYGIAVDLSPPAATALEIAGWVIWALFLTEFLTQLYLAPKRTRFLRRHWFQALALLVPTLRVLRFLRLVRLGRALPAARVVSSSYRTAGTARRLFTSRIGYLGAVSTVVAVAVAELGFIFERDHAEGVFASFGDALLWGFTVVVALQGDPVPESTGARLAMMAGFVFGLAVVASLAGAIGAFLLGSERAGDVDVSSGPGR